MQEAFFIGHKRSIYERPFKSILYLYSMAVACLQKRPSVIQNFQHGNHDTLILLHIPKNAGTSLRFIIERFYEKKDIYFIYTHAHGFYDINDFYSLSDFEKKKIKVFLGHVSFGLHNYIPQPCQYVTLLRNPVERMISLVSHVSQDPNISYYEKIKSKNMNIGEFVRSGIAFETDNHQTRVVAGIDPEFGKCTVDILEIAKKNLREYFTVVGLSEYFTESMLLMKKAFGWKTPFYYSFMRRFFGWEDPFYERTNISVNRFKKEDLSSKDLDAIMEFNKLDIQLYSYAKELFHEQFNRYVHPFSYILKKIKTG